MNEMEGNVSGYLRNLRPWLLGNVDLTDIQHDFREYISAVIHYTTEKYCLEVITLKGNIKYIRDLTEKIMRLKVWNMLSCKYWN